MLNNTSWEPNICDRCSADKVHVVANAKLPDGVIVNGMWVIPWSQERNAMYRKAQEEAPSELAKPCICLCIDYEEIHLCRDCLKELAES